MKYANKTPCRFGCTRYPHTRECISISTITISPNTISISTFSILLYYTISIFTCSVRPLNFAVRFVKARAKCCTSSRLARTCSFGSAALVQLAARRTSQTTMCLYTSRQGNPRFVPPQPCWFSHCRAKWLLPREAKSAKLRERIDARVQF